MKRVEGGSRAPRRRPADGGGGGRERKTRDAKTLTGTRQNRQHTQDEGPRTPRVGGVGKVGGETARHEAGARGEKAGDQRRGHRSNSNPEKERRAREPNPFQKRYRSNRGTVGWCGRAKNRRSLCEWEGDEPAAGRRSLRLLRPRASKKASSACGMGQKPPGDQGGVPRRVRVCVCVWLAMEKLVSLSGKGRGKGKEPKREKGKGGGGGRVKQN